MIVKITLNDIKISLNDNNNNNDSNNNVLHVEILNSTTEDEI